MNKGMTVLLPLAGLALGLIAGFIQRPSLYGQKFSLDVLASTNPADSMFREQMQSTLLSWGAGGLVIGIILVIVLHATMGASRNS